jgi:hypothetical protein
VGRWEHGDPVRVIRQEGGGTAATDGRCRSE